MSRTQSRAEDAKGLLCARQQRSRSVMPVINYSPGSVGLMLLTFSCWAPVRTAVWPVAGAMAVGVKSERNRQEW